MQEVKAGAVGVDRVDRAPIVAIKGGAIEASTGVEDQGALDLPAFKNSEAVQHVVARSIGIELVDRTPSIGASPIGGAIEAPTGIADQAGSGIGASGTA